MAVTYESNKYQIPRGRVYFDPYDSNDALTGERYLGNVPGFTVSVETESAEHFSSETGLRQKDAAILLEVTRTATMTVDNMSTVNVGMFLSGAESTVTQTSTTVSNEAHTVLQGRYYQLGYTTGTPAGARVISAVTVTDAAGTTTYDVGDDYNLDLDLGRIQIVEGGAIAASGAQIIHVDYTRPAKSWDRVATGGEAQLYGAMRVVADNASGDNRDFYMPYVSLLPSGEMPVIAEGTDFASMQFTVEVLKPASMEAIYIDGRPA
jgi:hypothetical protein